MAAAGSWRDFFPWEMNLNSHPSSIPVTMRGKRSEVNTEGHKVPKSPQLFGDPTALGFKAAESPVIHPKPEAEQGNKSHFLRPQLVL